MTPPISFTEDGLDNVEMTLTIAVDAATPDKSVLAMRIARQAIAYLRRERVPPTGALPQDVYDALVRDAMRWRTEGERQSRRIAELEERDAKQCELLQAALSNDREQFERIAELQRALEGRRKDTRRMDYLASRNMAADFVCDSFDSGRALLIEWPDVPLGASLRANVDAALATAQPSEG